MCNKNNNHNYIIIVVVVVLIFWNCPFLSLHHNKNKALPLTITSTWRISLFTFFNNQVCCNDFTLGLVRELYFGNLCRKLCLFPSTSVLTASLNVWVLSAHHVALSTTSHHCGTSGEGTKHHFLHHLHPSSSSSCRSNTHTRRHTEGHSQARSLVSAPQTPRGESISLSADFITQDPCYHRGRISTQPCSSHIHHHTGTTLSFCFSSPRQCNLGSRTVHDEREDGTAASFLRPVSVRRCPAAC